MADVIFISEEMSDLLQKGVRFSEEPVPDAMYTDVPAGKPLILYSPALVQQGVSSSLQKEIDRASGITGRLERMSRYYPNAFAGSKNGYLLMVQEKGEVIVSSKKEGFLSASRERQDLRQSGDASLAREAANMVEVKSDIRVVSVDGWNIIWPMRLLSCRAGALGL